ncbi:MAG: glycoside hydrolase family 5 protein [Anaerolineaceae bacterium]
MKKDVLKKGINVGGWLSQYPTYDYDHFKSFIQAMDIQRIAEWGFDHIRLPVDYPVFEDDKDPGRYLQNGFDYVHTCLDWCGQAGLRVILDLHKAPGYAFDDKKANRLEDDAGLHDRLGDLWEAITKEFASTDHDLLAFEILNEINFRSSNTWNDIVGKVLNRMWLLDPERLILIGGNYFSSVDHLSEIRIFPDPNILYKFHFYLPLSVTHQKAYWVEGLEKFDQPVDYPGYAEGLKNFLAKHPQYHSRLMEDVDVHFNRTYITNRMEPAFEFSKINQQPLHCGEFGVIDRASMLTRENWTRDVVSVLKEHAIGYAYWSYKAMDFGLVDDAGKIIDQKLIDILVR